MKHNPLPGRNTGRRCNTLCPNGDKAVRQRESAFFTDVLQSSIKAAAAPLNTSPPPRPHRTRSCDRDNGSAFLMVPAMPQSLYSFWLSSI